jgi:hypothetical protein
MAPRIRLAFLLLVLAQAVHSAEEYRFALWEQLAPARAVSRLVSIDPALGFLIANGALVLFGLWCWAVPLGRARRAARPIAWAWAGVETANGLAHCGLAVAAGGYFPGLATAPLLLAAAADLAVRLGRTIRAG